MHKNTYGAKTLNGNWLENRQTGEYDALNDATSNTYLPNPSYNKYVPMSRDIGDKKDFAKAKFGDATQNWMNFQPTFISEETFKTSARETMLPFEQRSEPFKLKTNSLTANEKAVEEYRDQWTRGNHNFARTYLGAPAYKKSLQE